MSEYTVLSKIWEIFTLKSHAKKNQKFLSVVSLKVCSKKVPNAQFYYAHVRRAFLNLPVLSYCCEHIRLTVYLVICRAAGIDEDSCCQLQSISFRFRHSEVTCVYVWRRGATDFDKDPFYVRTSILLSQIYKENCAMILLYWSE